MRSKRDLLLFVIFGLGVLSGCGRVKIEGLVPVRGTVTFNGEPLEGAAVCFTPKEFKTGDRLGTGKTDTAGRFELRTIGELGVLPGEYIVVVIKNEASAVNQPQKIDPKTKRPAPPKVKTLIPKRYSDPKTSDMSVVVDKNGLADWRLEIVD